MLNSVTSMTLEQCKDVAIIVGIVVAVLTYLTNSYFQFRNKRIENLKRYFDAHDKILEEHGFLMSNVKQFETNTYSRNKADADMEIKINRFLCDVEKIAYLTSYGAVPTAVQVYMFGWVAQKVKPCFTAEERDNKFWELAIHYIDELAKAADDYMAFPTKKREKYLRKATLAYKKYS